jgi:hypothetical protein
MLQRGRRPSRSARMAVALPLFGCARFNRHKGQSHESPLESCVYRMVPDVSSGTSLASSRTVSLSRLLAYL